MCFRYMGGMGDGDKRKYINVKLNIKVTEVKPTLKKKKLNNYIK